MHFKNKKKSCKRKPRPSGIERNIFQEKNIHKKMSTNIFILKSREEMQGLFKGLVYTTETRRNLLHL